VTISSYVRDGLTFDVIDSGPADGPVVAVGGDQLSRFTLDWPAEGGFVITGTRKSGRSSALAAVVHQLEWRKDPIVVVSGRQSNHTDVAARHLELSARTLRRRLRDICDRIGVSTPIEAVVWAARHDYI
jgi:S-DNA-T family DNA segregation ATPase FtsK/SpoIIIE